MSWILLIDIYWKIILKGKMYMTLGQRVSCRVLILKGNAEDEFTTWNKFDLNFKGTFFYLHVTIIFRKSFERFTEHTVWLSEGLGTIYIYKWCSYKQENTYI